MKIVFLLFSFTIGGTERLLSDVCNEMVKNNQDIYLYIVNDHYDQEMIDSLDKKVKVIYGRRKKGSHLKITPILKLSAFLAKNKFDVIHCNSINTLELLLLSKVMFRKAKIFYTIHAMNTFVGKSKKRINYYNKKCNGFFAISNSVKENVVECGIDSNKTSVVYNAVNFDKFSISNKEIDYNNIKIGMVARILPEIKGQDVLIDAVSLLKDKYHFTCLFAGKPGVGDDAKLQQLIDKTKNLDLEKECVFLGNVNDVNGFLSDIDIFVLPSRHEGFGISLIEALACGVPCLSSNIDGPKEISENERLFSTFKNGDYYDLANKLEELIASHREEKRKTIDNVNYIKQKYNIVTMCNNLLNRYDKIN